MKNCDLSSESTWPLLGIAPLGREITIWLLVSWATSQLAVPVSISGTRFVGNWPRIALGLNVKKDKDPVKSFGTVLALLANMVLGQQEADSPCLAWPSRTHIL